MAQALNLNLLTFKSNLIVSSKSWTFDEGEKKQFSIEKNTVSRRARENYGVFNRIYD